MLKGSYHIKKLFHCNFSVHRRFPSTIIVPNPRGKKKWFFMMIKSFKARGQTVNTKKAVDLPWRSIMHSIADTLRSGYTVVCSRTESQSLVLLYAEIIWFLPTEPITITDISSSSSLLLLPSPLTSHHT